MLRLVRPVMSEQLITSGYRMKTLLKRNHQQIMAIEGFTLLELMIALALSSFLVITLGTVYTNQQRHGTTQKLTAEVQQNIRSAMYIMGREIRMAGFDFRKTANTGFTTATATAVTFTRVAEEDDKVDNDGDGTVDETDEVETIAYYLHDFGDGDTDMARHDVNVLPAQSGQPIAENIDAVEFFYTMDDSTQTLTPANLADIRAVTISLLARTWRADPEYVDNRVYTPAGGTAWDLGNGAGVAAGDNYHRRLLTTTIQCRNLGL